jgi:hypothetical protein
MRTLVTILFLAINAFNIHAQNINMAWEGDTLPNFKYITEKTYTSEKELISGISQIQLEAFQKGYLNFSLNGFLKLDSFSYRGTITLGKQYIWDEIELKIKGPNIPIYLKPKLKNKLISSTGTGDLYKKIISYYQNNGFPFTEISFDSLSFNKNVLSGILDVDVKQRIYFDTLAIRGKPKLKTFYLQNYLGIIEGELYSEATFKSIEKKIKELPFVQLTDKPTIRFSKNKATITLPLKHKSSNFINGIIGVLPNSNSKLNPSDESKLVITGDLKLSLGNAFKYGEKIKFNWKRIQTETQQLHASTEIPYLFKTLFGINYELDLLKQDTSYINYKNKIGLAYSLGAKRNLKAFWENEGTNKLTDSPIHNTTLSSINSATNSYGLQFLMDERDYKFNPRKGFLLKLFGKAGIKKLTGTTTDGRILIPLTSSGAITTSISAPQTSVLYEAKLRFEIFLPIFRVTSIKLATNSGWLQNRYLLDNDLTRLGGFVLLRGFDEASIFASAYSVNSFEYRILFEQNSHVAIFYDQGIIAKNTLIENTSTFPFGFGVGVNFQTKPGIFSVSYAVGKQNGNPIDFSAAKIHFGFVNLF